MYIKRKIDEELQQWKASTQRKPLLLRGARQVGKSSAVRNLAKSFEHFVEINFDENSAYSTLFDGSKTPKEICELLTLLTSVPIIEGKTLVFFDEIQACVPAITSLRYFYEKLPGLHLIAAGSLLEFVLSDLPSFGVGRIRSLHLYPFSFIEFLNATENAALVKYFNENKGNEITELIHSKLTDSLKKFLVIGGMPEAVKVYVQTQNLVEVQRVLDDLIQSLEDDFAKYKQRVPSVRIREVFNAIVRQTGRRFNYSYNSSLTNSQVKEVLELLKMAGLIHSVTHSASNGLPLGAEINEKKRKYLLFDTGIFQRMLGLSIGDIFLYTNFDIINKGNLAELYVGLELIKSQTPYQKIELYYWHREARNSQAEVDYVIQKQTEIIPIEVKAGTKGSMQSLYLFMDEKKVPYGVRTSLENFGSLENVRIIPLYAIHSVFA